MSDGGVEFAGLHSQASEQPHRRIARTTQSQAGEEMGDGDGAVALGEADVEGTLESIFGPLRERNMTTGQEASLPLSHRWRTERPDVGFKAHGSQCLGVPSPSRSRISCGDNPNWSLTGLPTPPNPGVDARFRPGGRHAGRMRLRRPPAPLPARPR